MPDEKLPELKPGFASAEVATPPEAPATPKPKSLAVAHYDGADEDAAVKIWRAETLCVSCVLSSMCKIATECPEPMAVITRCLAYIPVTG